jgi:hypothetical protein
VLVSSCTAHEKADEEDKSGLEESDSHDRVGRVCMNKSAGRAPRPAHDKTRHQPDQNT